MLLAMIIGAAGGEAHHGDDHGFNWVELVALTLNFVILVWLVPKVIKAMTGKAPREHLRDQREQFAAQLREAESKQAEAEKRLLAYEKKLANLEDEVRAIVKSYEAQGDADRQRLEEEADRALERLVREADFTIRQESLKAQKTLRAEGVRVTLELAEKLVLERMTDADRRRLADEYVGAIETNGAAPPR